MATRELVFSDGSSNKFWNIKLDGDSHTVHYGRVGTSGQTKTKEFASDAAAKTAYDKLVEQKVKKGYVNAKGGATKKATKKATVKKAVKKAVKKKAVKKKAATKKAVKKKAVKKAATKKAVKKKVVKKAAAKKAVKKKAVKKKAVAKKATPKKAAKKVIKKKVAQKQGKSAAATNTCQLVFDDASSSKFWNIALDGKAHTVQYGRQGTTGQSKTKEFPSTDAARKSFDKLVAEKRKKGYTDSGSSSTTAVTPKSATATSKKSKAAAKAEAPTAPATEVDLKVTQVIDLNPEDWGVASFRKREKHHRGKPEPADLDAAVEKLAAMKPVRYGWAMPWETLALSPSMAREDAHFWFQAMTHYRGRLENKAAVATWAAKVRKSTKFNGKVTVAEAAKRLVKFEWEVPDTLLLVLYRLFTAEQCLEIALTPPPKNRTEYLAELVTTLYDGFRLHILPYITQKELAALQKRVKKTLDPAAEPEEDYDAFPVEHYLAAAFGMHKEIYAITSSWEDDRYKQTEEWLDNYQRPQALVMGLSSPQQIEAEWRRLKLEVNRASEGRGLLACTEFSCLDILTDSILKAYNKEKCTELLDILALVRAPEAAEHMLQCRLSSKVPALARDWMSKYVGNTVAGLIETAGKRGKLGDAALDYLRGAKREGYQDLIVKCVKKAGKKSAGAARVQKDVLDHEEKIYAPMDAKSTPKWLKKAFDDVSIAKPIKMPGWATPAAMAPITVGNHRLNDDQLMVVLEVLAATPLTAQHPLLDGLNEHADKQSRDAFAWQLFQLWQEDGANAKLKWAMASIGHLGDDGCVLKLTPLVRAWPGESQHPRAVLGLECLRGIGSDLALMQLSGIAQKLKFKGLKARAATFVEEIAKEKGMTRAELEDRVIPDCGLDEMGRREISFGPRSFSFVLGGDLKPMVRDDKGKVRPNPPQPGVNDDEKIAKQSLEEWKLIKKQIKEVAVVQSGRLEQAMVTGRRWSPEDFTTLLVRHPLMTHLAQKLIWGSYSKAGKRLSLFRVTEERDYADVADKPTSLAKANAIGLPHPLDLTDAERSKWGELLSDYEIISPFPQLGREVYSLEKGEPSKKELTRFHNLKLYAPTMVFTLEKLGWTRGEAMDAGCFDEHSKQFQAANVTAVIGYDGTVGMGYIDPEEMLKTDSIHFCAGMRKPSGYRWGSKKTMKLGDVPPIVISEVLADLQVLKSKAK